MNDLRWSELAAHVVAWHNRHPLARRIGVQHVHSLGYVMLPFVDDGAGSAHAATPRAVPGGSEPLPPEALSGSLRERAMARAQLEAQGAASAASAGDAQPPELHAPVKLRPAFDEDFMQPHSPKSLRQWAARHAVAQTTPRGEVQVRKVKAEPGVNEAQLLPRWALTAQVEVGRARTRVLVGPGARPPVLGRRLLSPWRTLALLALVAAGAAAAAWLLDRADDASPPPVATAPPAPSVAVAKPVSTVASAVVVSEPAPSAPSGHSPDSVSLPVSPASAAAELPASAAPAAASLPTGGTAARAAAPPLDVEPQLGKVDLPSLGPRIDERRRRVQEAAASAAQARPAAQQPPAHTHTGPSFAVATRLLRTRSESEQLAAAMRELLAKQPGPPVRVEVLAAGDDWRVVGWPYTDRTLADKAQALLASRGMKVQVIDF